MPFDFKAGLTRFRAIVTPATPSLGTINFYAKSDNKFYSLGSDAVEHALMQADDNYAWRPSQNGLLAATCDPALVSVSNQGPTAGVLALSRIRNPGAISFSTIYYWVTTAGATLTNVGVGVWNTSGTLLTSRVNANGATTAAFQAVGIQSISLASAQVIAAGAEFYVGIWVTGTTIPKLAAVANVNVMNINLATGIPPTGTLRFANANTGLTTTAPSSLTTLSNAAGAFWAGVA